VDLVREVIVGPDIKGEKNDKTPPDIVLWTKSHYAKESMFLVASEKHSGDTKEAPVSFLSVSLPIQYKIRPDRIFDFAYRHNNGEKFLRNIGEREAVKYFAGVDILKVMSFGRGKAVEDLKKMIQTESDKEDLGVDILFVNLHDAHPPIEKVAPAFQDVIGALEDKESEILKADAFKNTVIPGAEAEAEKLRFEALSYSANITAVSKAESERFVKQLAAFSVMPGMFKLRTYLDFLENDCKHLRKFITSSSIPSEIYEVNLEEKARLDLLDANLGDIAPAKK
jgi:regulator of protease activity HflC (stomatin/prohibitin superfamily)